MTRLTVAQLEEELVKAFELLRGINASERLNLISELLILKRASDQPGILTVPEPARWSHIAHSGENAVYVLNEALRQLERSNPIALNGVLEGIDYSRRLSSVEAEALISYFDRISLRDDDLEFADVVGRAFDRAVGWFAHQAGKRGGEFYTPRSVIQLMVRLVRPEAGQSVYDPFAGSAGMLIGAKEYVTEHSQDGSVALFGQENNASTRSIAQFNLLLHGVENGSILYGDTLANPLHMFLDGRRRSFNRILTNPPFSTNYPDKSIRFPERMRYGWMPGKGGKADLMNVQHVLSMLDSDGIGAVVAPQGMLFRGGAEAEIRRRIIEDHRLEAVIGIGANVFHGTALPACILVLRGVDGPPAGRRGRVLFINAEREVVTGRTQNRLEPAHIEKIVNVFRNGEEVHGFSRAVTLDEISDNAFNLNIRRYVDTNPPMERSLDVQAVIFGGVPKGEVEAEAHRFRAFGLEPFALFEPNGPDRLAFLPEGYEATATNIRELTGSYENAVVHDCHKWWQLARSRIESVAGTGQLLKLRPELMNSFYADLSHWEALGKYKLIGAFADWWSDHEDDLRSLDYRGFQGVIDHWTAGRGNSDVLVSGNSVREEVFGVIGDDLATRVEFLLFEERQALVETFRMWGEQYATSLMDLEEQRELTATRLMARLENLGYT